MTPEPRWTHEGGDLLAAATALAGAGTAGALLRLQLERPSGRVADVDPQLLRRLWERLLRDAPVGTVGLRAGWNVVEALAPGGRADLLAWVVGAVDELRADSRFRGTLLRGVLIRLREDPSRTLCCDPGYDLRADGGDRLLWVEPYPGDDWRSSQRYPTTTAVWPVDPGV